MSKISDLTSYDYTNTCEFKDSQLNNFEEILLPDSIEEIFINQFKDNKTLKRLVLPESVRKIGPNAFDGCENLTLTFDSVYQSIICDMTFESLESTNGIIIVFTNEELEINLKDYIKEYSRHNFQINYEALADIPDFEVRRLQYKSQISDLEFKISNLSERVDTINRQLMNIITSLEMLIKMN